MKLSAGMTPKPADYSCPYVDKCLADGDVDCTNSHVVYQIECQLCSDSQPSPACQPTQVDPRLVSQVMPAQPNDDVRIASQTSDGDVNSVARLDSTTTPVIVPGIPLQVDRHLVGQDDPQLVLSSAGQNTSTNKVINGGTTGFTCHKRMVNHKRAVMNGDISNALGKHVMDRHADVDKCDLRFKTSLV